MLKNKIQTCQFITLSDLFEGYDFLTEYILNTLTNVSFGDANRTMISLQELLYNTEGIYEPDSDELNENKQSHEVKLWKEFSEWSEKINSLDRTLYVDLEN